MAQARQALQGAQRAPIAPPQGAPQAPQQGLPVPPPQGAPQAPQQGLPVPPPHIANYFAQLAQTLHPQVLGTLIWRALQQHGATMGNQNQNLQLASEQPGQQYRDAMNSMQMNSYPIINNQGNLVQGLGARNIPAQAQGN